MANFTANEQLMLELINRARMDPAGEAARYGIALNEGLAAGTISTAPKQALAGNDNIGVAADFHTNWLLGHDQLRHDEVTDTSGYYATSPFDRMTKAGYTGYSTAGENLAWRGTTGTIDETQSVVELHKNLFVDAGVAGRGHRIGILNENFKEIGVGYAVGQWTQNSTTYNAAVVTTDFGARSGHSFITGVVYNDTATNDDFFTVGEQLAGVGVAGSGASDSTGAGGGYELSYASAGSKTVTFGAGTTVVVALADNVKVDFVNGAEIWSNASVLTSQSAAIKELHALGISKVNLNGSAGNEKIYGNAAGNKLNGNDGNDKLWGYAGNDKIAGGAGKDKLTGGDGSDKFVFKTALDSAGDRPDIVKDFGDAGTDKIDLSALFSGRLNYRDEAAITGANQVNVTASGNAVIIHVNLDADMADEVRIKLDNTTLSAMTAGDFIL